MANWTDAQTEDNRSVAQKPLREEPRANSDFAPKDSWDKADVIGKIVGALLIPLVVLFAGYEVNVALQKQPVSAHQFRSILPLRPFGIKSLWDSKTGACLFFSCWRAESLM